MAIPTALAANAGILSLDLISELKHRHQQNARCRYA